MDLKSILVALIAVALSSVGLRQYFKGGVFTSDVRIDGKVVIITGANTGIGKETAIDLAKRGGRIIMACRDQKRADAAAKDVRQLANVADEKVTVELMDLSSFKSVRAFADRINAQESHIDILINNAGVMWTDYTKTVDGNELQFQVNHLGHFLLTNLLLGKLKAAPKARVLTVSSLAHEIGAIKLDDLNSEKSYGRIEAYSQSKLANVLFSSSLAMRLQGSSVTTYSLHPGAVDTELARYAPVIGNKIVYKIIHLLLWPFFKTSEEGAQTTNYCAVEPSIADETGKYYSDCAEKKPASQALDKDVAEKLWTLSEKMVGLKA